MGLERLTDVEFEEFSHQLVRALLELPEPGLSLGYVQRSVPYRGDRKADGAHQDGFFAGPRRGLVLFSFKTSNNKDLTKARAELRERIRDEVDEQAAQGPVELVVFVNRTVLQYDRDSIEVKVAGRFLVTLYGARDLEAAQAEIWWPNPYGVA